MKQTVYEIVSNNEIAHEVYEMKLSGDTSAFFAPGQFMEIKVDSLYLRRPISICDYDENGLTIIYRVVGKGTDIMSNMKSGKIDALTGLGNGFDTSKSGDKPILLGGGVGTPPMYGLCKTLVKEGKKPHVVLGFNSKRDVFYEDKFKEIAEISIATADGTYGTKGFVTDCMKKIDYSYFYTCGPMPMYRAIESTATTSGQYSFEERMGCGFGACMGCSMMTKSGAKRVCKDGPVFEREDLIW